MRVVLDTVWVGLNTGHVLVFETNATEPSLITHFKVHKSEVREILLLHPSYLGPSSVHSTTEMVSIMEKSKTGTFSSVIPDSVYVLCFGTGLHEMIPDVNKTGRLKEITEKDEEMKKVGLYGVVVEGMVAARMKEIERRSIRATLPYMEGYIKTDDGGGLEAIYDVPPDFQYDCGNTDTFLRRTTWTAENTDSPVRSIHLPKMRTLSEDDPNGLYVSIERPDNLPKSGSNCSAMSDSPPHLPPRPPDLSADEPASHYSVPRSVKAKESPQVSHYDVPKSSVRKSITNLFKRKKAADERRASDEQKAAATQEDENDLDPDSGYDYPYSYTIPRSMTGLSPQKLTADPRRSTMACSRPIIEDSGEHQGYDPYVRMDTFFDPNLRLTATKAKARAQARRELIQHARRGQMFDTETVHHDQGDGDDDFSTVEDFLSPSNGPPPVTQQATPPTSPPTTTTKPQVPRKPAQWTPPRPPKTKPRPPKTESKDKPTSLDDESAPKDLSEEKT